MVHARRLTLALVLAALSSAAAFAAPAAGAAFERSALAPCEEPRIAEETLLEPAPANHPPLPDACGAFIRPGASLGGFCTLNFVFTDSAANLYIGTAGHCINVGQRASLPGVGQFGTAVFSRAQGSGNDFALIKIDASRHAITRPTLCTWGGPIGAADPGSTLPRDVLYEYGWGTATVASHVTRARAHVAWSEGANSVSWIGEGSGGDSGAPLVNQAGYAVAIHTHGITPFAGVFGESGATIGRILTMGREAVPSLTLVTGDPSSLENAMLDLTY